MKYLYLSVLIVLFVGCSIELKEPVVDGNPVPSVPSSPQYIQTQPALMIPYDYGIKVADSKALARLLSRTIPPSPAHEHPARVVEKPKTLITLTSFLEKRGVKLPDPKPDTTKVEMGEPKPIESEATPTVQPENKSIFEAEPATKTVPTAKPRIQRIPDIGLRRKAAPAEEQVDPIKKYGEFTGAIVWTDDDPNCIPCKERDEDIKVRAPQLRYTVGGGDDSDFWLRKATDEILTDFEQHGKPLIEFVRDGRVKFTLRGYERDKNDLHEIFVLIHKVMNPDAIKRVSTRGQLGPPREKDRVAVAPPEEGTSCGYSGRYRADDGNGCSTPAQSNCSGAYSTARPAYSGVYSGGSCCQPAMSYQSNCSGASTPWHYNPSQMTSEGWSNPSYSQTYTYPMGSFGNCVGGVCYH